MNYNLSFQRQLTPNLAATISYVGNSSRHLGTYADPNAVRALYPAGTSTQQYQPFPDLGGIGTIHYGGVSTYNSLQAKAEKRASHGLSFLATYTWAHAMDDTGSAGGLSTGIGDRQRALVPLIDELTNSVYDVRNRFTLNGNYLLPFGKGRAYLNHSVWADEIVGGWSSSLTWVAQSGTPFTVYANNTAAAGGTDTPRANVVRDPFSPGGSPDPSNTALTAADCPTSVRNRTNWYNPCAFANPLPGNLITTPVTDLPTVIQYLGGKSNQIYGPGYYGVNMSLFKNFATWHEQYLQFRADAFNVLNHPTFGNPSTNNLNANAGNITGPKTFQNNTPDARFFQLSLKYAF
jgi:hypothetical protein